MAIERVGRDYGIDVCKESLSIEEERLGVQTIANDRQSISTWLRSVPKGSCFAVEATGTYHRTFVDLSHRRGCTVYLVDGYRLSRYRDSLGVRAKNDPLDAWLLRRYLQREKDDLRVWEPPPTGYTELLGMLHRRERIVTARVAIEQSARDFPACQRDIQLLLRRMRSLATRLEQRIVETIQASGWEEAWRRCQQIEGIGPLTSAALATIYQRGSFRNADAFIAFLGLDVRVRDSGKQRGKRKLTKKGDTEARRLLYNAAMSAASSPAWSSVYQHYLQRGLKRTQALVALSRKLARVAFALMRDNADYRPHALMREAQ